MRRGLVVCGSLLWLLVCGCTSSGKCRRGDLGCVCRNDGGCALGSVCVRGACVKPVKTSANMMPTGVDQDAGATPGQCEATSFENACRGYCEAFCRKQAEFCTASRCEPGYCEPGGGPELGQDCRTTCTGDPDPIACANDLCAMQTRQTCADFRTGLDTGMAASSCFNDDPVCPAR